MRTFLAASVMSLSLCTLGCGGVDKSATTTTPSEEFEQQQRDMEAAYRDMEKQGKTPGATN